MHDIGHTHPLPAKQTLPPCWRRVATKSKNGAPFREGCAVNGQMTQGQQQTSTPLPPHPPPADPCHHEERTAPEIGQRLLAQPVRNIPREARRLRRSDLVDGRRSEGQAAIPEARLFPRPNVHSPPTSREIVDAT